MKHPCPAGRVYGFTLIELVVGLALASLLLGLVAPGYARFLAEQKLLGEARRLSEAIMLARSEAVKRNGHVVLCTKGAADACGSTGHWHGGWLMFVDTNADAEIDPHEAVIGQEGGAENEVTLIGNRPVREYFRFNFAGQARMVSGALQMGTVEVCRPGFRGYHVILANSGRTRIERAPGTCV